MKHLRKFEGFIYESEEKCDDCCKDCGCEMVDGKCPECKEELNERKKASKKKEEKDEPKGKGKKEEKDDSKGLTAAQKRLPPGLRAAIAKRKNK